MMAYYVSVRFLNNLLDTHDEILSENQKFSSSALYGAIDCNTNK